MRIFHLIKKRSYFPIYILKTKLKNDNILTHVKIVKS